MSERILEAPCIFCGYDGPGYFQPGTHKPGCPWRGVGGHDERLHQLREVVDQLWNDWRDGADERAKCLAELRPWLDHKGICAFKAVRDGIEEDHGQKCTCGYDKAVSALLGEERDEEGGRG